MYNGTNVIFSPKATDFYNKNFLHKNEYENNPIKWLHR